MSFNLDRIVGNEISGIEEKEIEFLSEFAKQLEGEDGDIQIDQFSGLLSNMDTARELPDLPDEVLCEIDKIDQECRNKSTDDATRRFSNKFKDFLIKNKLPSSIETMPVRYLAQYLRFWNSKLMKEKYIGSQAYREC